jgi:predicted dehydrogenase
MRAAAAAGAWAAARRLSAEPASPNEKILVGIIGAGGRGAVNAGNVAAAGGTIAALCDVDERHFGPAAKQFPDAMLFRDFRRLLERRDIDAVVISTADHTHAAATTMALGLGKHVYCEKPLTHSVHEARVVAQAAAKAKRATQMGNLGHSSANVRRIFELVRDGVVGPIREVHCWTNRPLWPQGIDRPAETPEIPKELDWDLWLGPAPARPYHDAYHPFKWRGWWDFGTGSLGDMACHVMDSAFWSLDLGAPESVEAEGEPRHPETAPKWCVITYRFPAKGARPPVKLVWYDGGRLPPPEALDSETPTENGAILIGEKGKIAQGVGVGGGLKLYPLKDFEAVPLPPKGTSTGYAHYTEWLECCRTGKTAGTDFTAYGGPLTEMVLLGNVAFRVGRKIEWDAENLKAKNCPEADAFLRREYRKGWTL